MNKYAISKKVIILADGHKVHRIKALRDIPLHNVKAGDLGGYIESRSNLSQRGMCWIGKDSFAIDKSRVSGNAVVDHGAHVECHAKVYGTAKITNGAIVSGKSRIRDTLIAGFGVPGQSKIYANRLVSRRLSIGDMLNGICGVLCIMVMIFALTIFLFALA